MNDIVLLHGSAGGSYAWRPVATALEAAGRRVFAPDMLGYGRAPAPGADYRMADDLAYLTEQLDARNIDGFHLVTHSMGTMYGLHWRRMLGQRVQRLTLVDPVVLSVLRQAQSTAAYNEMDQQYQAFMGRLPDMRAAVAGFMDHWGGAGTWAHLGANTQQVLTAMGPKVRLEMRMAVEDTLPWQELTAAAPPTTLLVGDKTLLAPRATAELLRGPMQARIVMVPGAGHLIPSSHPAAVTAAILEAVPA